MTFTLLTLGAMIAVTRIYAVATRSSDTVDPVAPVNSDDATLVGSSDPATMTLSGDTKIIPPQPGWHVTKVTALRDAEELLDCLETQGFQERELVLLGESCFAIRWR